MFYLNTTREIRIGDEVVGIGTCDGQDLHGVRGRVTNVSRYEGHGCGYVCRCSFFPEGRCEFSWAVRHNNIMPADMPVPPRATTCTVCGKTITRDMVLGERLYRNGNWCDSCVASQIGQVHGYHFGKDLQYAYAKNKITLGVELEIDDCDDEGDRDAVISDVMNYARTHKYPLIMHHERDGSLNNAGFESPTAPFTIDEWRKPFVQGQVENLLASAEENGFDFYERNSAGLHVHIGRKDLGCATREESDAVGLLMGWAVTRLWNKGFRELSRRRDTGYTHLLDEYGDPKTGLYDTEATSDRYYAVNIENKNTLELRIFKGARNLDDVLVAVDFCYMLAKWAVKKIHAFKKRGSYTARAGKYDDCLEYADRVTWGALVKFSKFPEVTLPAMRRAGIDV